MEETYSYVYNGSLLMQMTVTTSTTEDGTTTTTTDILNFTYDATGRPVSVTWNGVTYYYAVNLQGDVLAILDSTGVPVASYSYDAWGNHLDGDRTDGTIGALNPLRYRGYVWDRETKLYYLESRYYNPETGRFINADGYTSTGQGILGNNMFAYCHNNPIAYTDPHGEYAAADKRGMLSGVGGGGSLLEFFFPLAWFSEILTVATSTKNRSENITKTEAVAGVIADTSSDDSKIYSVYFLCAAGDATKTIIYVGRVKTANFNTRMRYHESRGRAMVSRVDNLDYETCRAMEQAGMMFHHTRNRGVPLYNQIRGISPLNHDKGLTYFYAVKNLIAQNAYPDSAFLPASYWENLTEEAFLNGSF